MDYKTPSPRYLPLNTNYTETPVLLIDTKAPLKDLHACADMRFRLATRFLDSLAHMRLGDVQDHDLKAIVSQAYMLLQEGCDVNQVVEQRLIQPNAD
ncbi:MAG: hypothetical protein PW845_02230 [Pseudomonas sp.]|nr:hypothetical protein [Pseudomonas sp.]